MPTTPGTTTTTIVFPASQIAESFRKFDGNSPVESWLQKYEGDLDSNGYDEKWALINLDRVLLGNVSCWWSSVESTYLEGLDDTNKARRWKRVKDELGRTFGDESLRQQSKLRNSQLNYKLGEDPQVYVLKKLEIFVCMDAQMTNEKKLDYLIERLPESIAIQMLCSIDRSKITPFEFLDRLRSCVNYLQKRKGKQKEESNANWKNEFNVSSVGSHRANFRRKANQASGRGRGKGTRGNYRNDNRREKACFHCGKIG